MKHLKQLYLQNRNCTQINLQFLQITDLAPLMPYIQKFNQMTSLSLHGNRLKSLPDLSKLKNLKDIDITNNSFPTIEDFLEGLVTLPNLTILNCNLSIKEQFNKIIKALPKLKYLNKFQVIREKKTQQIVKAPPNLIEHVEDVNSWFSSLTQLFKVNNVSDEKMTEEYWKQLQSLNNQLRINLKDRSNLNNNVDAETRVIFSKHKLIDFCFDKLMFYLERTDGYLYKVVQGIRNLILNSVSKMKEIILYKPSTKTQQDDEQNDNGFKREKKYIEMISLLKKQEDRLLEQINTLQIQNKTYLQSLKEYGIGRGGHHLTPQKSHKNLINATPTKLTKSFSRPLHESKNQTNQLQNHLNNNKKISQLPLHSKTIKLSQLKDLIYEIYEAKIQFDKKCYSLKKPIETMEQYVYLHFNKKYGLKQITIEWIVLIVNGIKNYAQIDPVISVFGRVLRNQFQEDFWKSQLQLKYTIEDIVNKQYKSQLNTANKKQKHRNNINENQQLFLSLNNILDIIGRIYSENDYFKLRNHFEQAIYKRKSKINKDSNIQIDRIEDQTLTYIQFINLVLEWEIKQHQILLSDFLKNFRLTDTNKDGIISIKQFKSLYLNSVTFFDEKQFNNILEIIDPWKTGILTFSAICSVLQYQPESKPLIDKI